MANNEILDRLGDIEDAILERLQSKQLAVREFSIQDDPGAVITPAANVGLTDGLIQKTGRSYKFDLTYTLTLLFKSLRDERSRRRGVYPLMMAALMYLAGQRLSLAGVALSIDPIRLGQVKKVVDEDGIIAYAVAIETGFYFEPTSDIDDVALTTLMAEYFVQPDDDDADLSGRYPSS